MRKRNLPNKSRFGKQDPFCTVLVGEEKQRTKAIKRYVLFFRMCSSENASNRIAVDNIQNGMKNSDSQ
jgi:hypothetical protein